MKKFLFRILLSPLAFLWGVLILVVGSFFPLPLMVGISLIGLIWEPFVWLFRQAEIHVEFIEPAIDTENRSLGHFLGCLVYLWLPFIAVYQFILDGELIGIEK